MKSPVDAKDAQLIQEFVELDRRISELPPYLRGTLLPLCDKVGHFIRLQSRLINIAQEAVDDLQLEATHREKEELIEMMEDDQDD